MFTRIRSEMFFLTIWNLSLHNPLQLWCRAPMRLTTLLCFALRLSQYAPRSVEMKSAPDLTYDAPRGWPDQQLFAADSSPDGLWGGCGYGWLRTLRSHTVRLASSKRAEVDLLLGLTRRRFGRRRRDFGARLEPCFLLGASLSLTQSTWLLILEKIKIRGTTRNH